MDEDPVARVPPGRDEDGGGEHRGGLAIGWLALGYNHVQDEQRWYQSEEISLRQERQAQNYAESDRSPDGVRLPLPPEQQEQKETACGDGQAVVGNVANRHHQFRHRRNESCDPQGVTIVWQDFSSHQKSQRDY